jgi:hypothetical protein
MRKPVVSGLLLWALCLLLGSCRPKPVQTTSISLDPPKAKLGGAVRLRVDQAPPSWSGQIAVRNANVRVDANNPGFQLTAVNGFTETGNTDLYVSLVDAKGYEIPLANRGRLILEVLASSVTIEPSSDEVSPGGGSGKVRVSAADDFHWSATGLPDWIQLSPAAEGTGTVLMEYKAPANTTGRDRVARIAVGDAVFELRQPAQRSSGFSPFRTAGDTTKNKPGAQKGPPRSDSSATSK